MAARSFDSATVVLGMHRSGTSALTGSLHLCGLTVPEAVIEASAANERGFWEPAEIKTLDDEVLGRFDRTWFSLLPIDFDSLGTRATDQLRKRASEILKREYPKNTNIVLKEPRLCLLAPLWKPVLQRLATRVSYALIIRNPLEVAKSLARRNGFDLNHGLLLWARYSLDAEVHTRGEQRAVVSYADLVDHGASTMKALAARAGIPIEVDRASARSIEEYLATDLRHHRESDEDSLAGKPAEVAETYALLRTWSEGHPESDADHAKLDLLREQLDRMTVAIADVFESARRDRKRWADARAQIQENTSTLASLQQSLEQSLEIKRVLEANSASISALRTHNQESAEKLSAADQRLGAAVEEVSSAARRLGDAQEKAFGSLERSLDALGEAVTETGVRGGEIAAAVIALASDQGALLAEIRAKVNAAADAEQERSLRLSELSATVIQRQGEQAAQLSELSARMTDGQRQQAAQVSELSASVTEGQRQQAAQVSELSASVTEGRREQAAQVSELSASVSEGQREQAAQLSEISASVAQAAQQQELRFSDLSGAIQERRKLEEALEQAIRTGADVAAKLDRTEADAAAAAADFAIEKAQLEAEQRRTVEELRAREEALEKEQARAEAFDAELQRTKRKYRAAQWDVERETRAHDATRGQLAAAEATIARFRASLLWRSYTRMAGAASGISAILKGRSRTARKRRGEQLQSIASSDLFDRDWYLATYPDVATAGVDPLQHFFDLGWREGRDPGPGFATSSYLKANPDVVRAGVNPLVHYIEFGRSEGREAPPHRGPKDTPAAVAHEFPPPAPVFRGAAAAREIVPWTRSYRLTQDDPRLVTAGTLAVGYAATAEARIATEHAFERLAKLSGLPAPATEARPAIGQNSAALADSWYTSRAELRTRWQDDFGRLVVRAYQHDPMQDGRLVLVGEGLLASQLDVLDCSLANPYFPLLFVFADAGGSIGGSRLMAFPSLCRGGLHYPELIASSPDAPDPVEVGQLEADRLLEARGSPDRLVRSISLNPDGSDGSSPFQDRAFRDWLQSVAQVDIAPMDGAGQDRAKHAPAGGRLVLAADMIPALGILGQHGGATEPSPRPVVLPLLIAGYEPSQPATLIELPRIASMILGARTSAFPAPWPWFIPGEGGQVPSSSRPAAIRLPAARELSDSDLLAPCPGPALELAGESSADVTWLITARDWQTPELLQAFRALSLQSGAGSHVIGFIGDVDLLCRTVARELFGGRVRQFADPKDAAEGIDTALAGHIGAGIILHDSRCVSVFEALLSDSATVSAACMLVTTEKRGKSWHSSPVDGGVLTIDLRNGKTAPGRVHETALPWRACFPVSRPPRDLWLARSSSVKSWLATGATEPLRKGMHVCTSLVTASYASGPAEHVDELPLPSVTAGLSTKTRTLFG